MTNESISKLDKFNYFMGPAASTIAGLALTDKIYEANPQVIMSSHMDALLKLEPTRVRYLSGFSLGMSISYYRDSWQRWLALMVRKV